MRFDILRQDTQYFAEHFPAENYDALSYFSELDSPDDLDIFMEKIWTKNSGTRGNFWEALMWIRSDDFIEYEGFKAYSLNEHDTEYTYDSKTFQDWVLDDYDRFCIFRHASAVYNLPMRIVKKIGSFSIDKDKQAECVFKFIDEYKTTEHKA